MFAIMYALFALSLWLRSSPIVLVAGMKKRVIESNEVQKGSDKRLLKKFGLLDCAEKYAESWGQPLVEPKRNKSLLEHLEGASATQFNCIVQRGGELLNVRKFLDPVALHRLGSQVCELVHDELNACPSAPPRFRSSAASSSGLEQNSGQEPAPTGDNHYSPFGTSSEEGNPCNHDGYTLVAAVAEAETPDPTPEAPASEIPEISAPPILPVAIPVLPSGVHASGSGSGHQDGPSAEAAIYEALGPPIPPPEPPLPPQPPHASGPSAADAIAAVMTPAAPAIPFSPTIPVAASGPVIDLSMEDTQIDSPDLESETVELRT